MSRTIHISTSIRGLLRHTDLVLSKIAPCIKRDNGRPYSMAEVKLLRWDLQFKLDEGAELLPDDRCDNFDPKLGCLGHEEEGDHA
jgi:hypothetical protein